MTLAEQLALLHAASFPRPWSAQDFDTLLANPTTHAITTAHGFALLQIIPPEAEIITLSVLPSARGKGHGRALLQKALTHAQTQGAQHIFLEVEATNTAAHALYTSGGFSETGRRTAYYPQPDGEAADAILMALDATA